MIKKFNEFINESETTKLYGMDFTGVSPEDYDRYSQMLDQLYNSGDMVGADELLYELEEKYPDIFNKHQDDIKDIVFGM